MEKMAVCKVGAALFLPSPSFTPLDESVYFLTLQIQHKAGIGNPPEPCIDSPPVPIGFTTLQSKVCTGVLLDQTFRISSHLPRCIWEAWGPSTLKWLWYPLRGTVAPGDHWVLSRPLFFPSHIQGRTMCHCQCFSQNSLKAVLYYQRWTAKGWREHDSDPPSL